MKRKRPDAETRDSTKLALAVLDDRRGDAKALAERILERERRRLERGAQFRETGRGSTGRD